MEKLGRARISTTSGDILTGQ